MSIDEIFSRSIDEIIVKESFENKLKSKKLRVKMGFDPTKPDLHLGHMVGIRLLKKLQDAGHTIIFLIGDYTAKIGDPSGRNSTRPMLKDEEIKENAATYFAQVAKILNLEKAEIHSNSEWFDKMSLHPLMKLLNNFTLAQIIERDDFQKRLKAHQDIVLNELLYPAMQAFDSVQLKADIEVGGTDQKFNMLAGRDLQKKMGQAPQDIITIKLLVGTDGTNKMSKSLNNYIAVNDSASDMYGKIMSIPDSLIVDYFKLCTDVDDKAIDIIADEIESGKRNPRDIKAELAKLIVEMYHNAEEAENAETQFVNVYSKKEMPENIETREINVENIRIDDLLVELKLASSKSEAHRLIEQGGVEIAGNKITNSQANIKIEDGMIVRVGKRNFVRIKNPPTP